MSEDHLGNTATTLPCNQEEQVRFLLSRDEITFKTENKTKNTYFHLPHCSSSCPSSWKFWTVALSLLVIICFIGIALWVAWSRSNSRCNWGDETIHRQSIFPPVTCYKCSNNDYSIFFRKTRSKVQNEALTESTRSEANLINHREKMCQEYVNRTAFAETQAPSFDICNNGSYNGCFKMVTKSYRLISNEGRNQLIATIVTRNCVDIPRSAPLGCYKTMGGAGMERETCYCKGNYCNLSTPICVHIGLNLFVYLTMLIV